jgi:hypothetical protein
MPNHYNCSSVWGSLEETPLTDLVKMTLLYHRILVVIAVIVPVLGFFQRR